MHLPFTSGFTCPSRENVCDCIDIEMHCENRGLDHLPYDLSNEDITKFKELPPRKYPCYVCLNMFGPRFVKRGFNACACSVFPD
ncbi:hypothetical protein DPMN_072525 [Dreissena polymorpha]|uniref:Uncharacterized protein n=1 Tax=Dreissena polymorpha TaxID=45954 RepID=A0A9D3Z4Q1_DREPO|nr:hypothetical protein DPMN_072525 [Dreissena polymorpha]